MNKKNRLTVEDLDSVGLVTQGANGPAHIMITKAADGSEPPAPAGTVDVAANMGPIKRFLSKLRGAGTTPLSDDEAFEWLTKLDDDEFAKHRNMAHWIESLIHRDFTVRADELFGDGRLTREERIALSSAIGSALSAFAADVESSVPHLLERDPWDFPAAVEKGAQHTSTNVLPSKSRDTKESHQMPDNTPTLSEEALKALDADTSAYVKHLEDDAKAADEAKVAAETALAEATKTTEHVEDDPVAKALEGLPAEVAALIKSQNDASAEAVAKAEAVAAEALAKAEAIEQEALRKTYVAKAADLEHVANADELGPIMMKADTGVALTTDEAAQLAGWLKRANDLIETSDFYSEFGGNAIEGSPEDQLRKKAAELRKSDATLTQELAEAQVLQSDRELAIKLDQEARARAGR